jgi:hypothetical protein
VRRFLTINCGIALLVLSAAAQGQGQTPAFDAASVRIVAESGRGMMKILGPGYMSLRGGPGWIG